MNKDDFLSDEQANAFVDDELDTEEKSRVFAAAEQNPELEQRLCQQRKLGELMRHAYQDVPQPVRRLGESRGRRSLLGRALAASLFILVGIGGGLLAHWHWDQRAASSTALESGDFILHVSSGDEDHMLATLRKARQIVDASTENNPHHVEVVANEQGLNLLRSDVTPFAGEIAALARHDVTFYACARAIQRLEEQGVEVRLVEQAVSDFTALDRVVMRMNEGWHYLKL